MNTSPLVSVIIPAYNGEKYLAVTIQSALDQTYPHKEIIVVNDGSTDNTAHVIAFFGDRVRSIEQQNAGSAAARNHGIQAARGEFIAFLDADDLWLADKLRIQVDYLTKHPEVGAVYCSWQVWRPNGDGEFAIPTVTPSREPEDAIDPEHSGWLYNRLFHDSIIHTTALMVRREIIQQAGFFDTTLRRGQDYDYWFRLSRLAPIHKLKAVLSLYRIHAESITHKAHNINYPSVIIEKALAQWGRVGPDGTTTPQREIDAVLANHWFAYGYMHLKQGDPAIAVDSFIKCLRMTPLRVKAWVNLARSLVKRIF